MKMLRANRGGRVWVTLQYHALNTAPLQTLKPYSCFGQMAGMADTLVKLLTAGT